VRPTRDEMFEGLFRENYPAVRAYALRRASREAARDVVAETFRWPGGGSTTSRRTLSPGSTASRGVLANQRRSADRGAALELRLATAAAPAGAPDPGDTVGDNELMRLALGRLPERSREALILVAWHGITDSRLWTRGPALSD
jgi:DNA-directed RNA polymerase specialized sigma24 family protein